MQFRNQPMDFLPIKFSMFRQYIEALKILQDLYKIGFREVSHEVNMVAGPGGDMFYHFFEVVFLKVRNN